METIPIHPHPTLLPRAENNPVYNVVCLTLKESFFRAFEPDGSEVLSI